MEELASRTHTRQLAQDEFDDHQGGSSDPLFARGGGVVCCDHHPIREGRGVVFLPKPLWSSIVSDLGMNLDGETVQKLTKNLSLFLVQATH